MFLSKNNIETYFVIFLWKLHNVDYIMYSINNNIIKWISIMNLCFVQLIEIFVLFYIIYYQLIILQFEIQYAVTMMILRTDIFWCVLYIYFTLYCESLHFCDTNLGKKLIKPKT